MHRYRILTVGDGDLSLSVALARAYNENIELIPSTLLPDAFAIQQTYPTTAEGSLAELEQRGIAVRYGIDATQLHRQFGNNTFDLVIFQHPHLGDYEQTSTASEAQHLQRHHVLLSHYLASAASILSNNGRVQVALKTNQARSWELYGAAARVGLVECSRQTTATASASGDVKNVNNDHEITIGRPSPMPVQHPFHYIFGKEGVALEENSLPPPSFVKASRQARMSRTASKHWLGKYGYRPMRTFPFGATGKMDVAGSMHYFFERPKQPLDVLQPVGEEMSTGGGGDSTRSIVRCSVCGVEFATAQELEVHALAPALPVSPSVRNEITEQLSYQWKEESSSSSSADNTEKQACRKEDSDDDSDGATPDTTTDIPCNLAVEAELVVSPEHEDSRLRWFLHHVQLKDLKSKRECQRLITSGRILVNGQVALDSGRILHAGNIVALASAQEEKDDRVSNKGQRIQIVDSWTKTCHLVWKPVGMRTIGSFDANTLEQTFCRQQHETSYRSLSKLDTGASGLCILVDSGTPRIYQGDSIIHTFSALVFGHVPSNWKDGVKIQLPVEGKRQWRRQVKYAEDDADISSTTALATLHCLEQTSKHESLPPLSTITVSTDSGLSGLVSIICSYLRKVQKHPVVGDRFVASEYKQLPRFLRNRLKNRLCIACTCIQSGQRKTEHPVPKRWCASFWDSEFRNMRGVAGEGTRSPSLR